MINRLLLASFILLPASVVMAQSTYAIAPVPPTPPSAPSPLSPMAALAPLTREGRWSWGAEFPQDPADSTYREARSMLNRGEWRRASTLFGQITQRQPASAYAADALYWQAFALYRIGGVTELREALTALDARKSRFPRAGNSDEAETLTTRVSGALAARGDTSASSRVRASASGAATACDSEELSVRSSALSVLMRSNPDAAMPILTKVLDRRDECSVSLRKSAVMMIGTKGDAAAKAKLSDVARNDPSPSVRADAIEYLARASGEEVVSTLEAVIRADSNQQVQRAAVRALGAHESAKAKTAIRALIERASAPEFLRAEAIATFDRSAGLGYSYYCESGDCSALSVTTGMQAEWSNIRGMVASVASPAAMAPPAAPSPAPTPRPAVARAIAPRAFTVNGAEVELATLRNEYDRRISAEDAAWLRGVYPRLETPRLKSRAAAVLARAQDEPTKTWLMGLVQREEEPADVRGAIINRMGRDFPIAQLTKLYDNASSRTIRTQVVNVLGLRPEPEATDKLIDIVRTGTDPQLRRAAISALNGKKDPRTTQLLLELIDR